MREKEERRTNSLFSRLIFLTLIRINGILGVYFTLEKLKVFIYKSFAQDLPAVFILELLLYLKYRMSF